MNFLSVLYAKAGITVDGVTTLNNTATALTPATNDNSTNIATTAFVKNQNYYPYPTGTTAQYVRGDGSLATFPELTGYVPYTGATANVDLGSHSLTASDLVINHASGSGVAASITKGGNGEALTVVKSSGSGNAASITGGTTLISELNLTTDLADAYIASAATWNAKQDAITLTTTGTSGAATLVGSTLNIPQYQSVLTNPITGTGTTNYLPKFTGASALGNSIVSDNGTRVTIDGDFRVALADANINLQGTSKSYLLQVVDSDNRLRIYDNTANAERFTITSAGNVGIGTTSPSHKVHINSTDDDTYALRVQGNTNNVSGVWTGIGLAGEGSNTKVGILFEDVGVSYSRGKLIFAVNNAADQTNATPANAVMTLMPSGNVLIGTTTDADFKLDVNGTARFSGDITISGQRIKELTSTNKGIYIGNWGGAGYWGLGSTATSHELKLDQVNQSTGAWEGATDVNLYLGSNRLVIHSGNIGSQSVAYATTAGALTSMLISQFTNDAGYITSTSSTFSYTASVTLSPTWQNTGVSSTNLGTGAYLVTCNADDFGVGGGQYNCTYTGLMYFFAGGTNGSNANEIVLHHTGHADNNRYIYLRTLNTVATDGKTYLQISGNGTNSAASNYQLTFKKLL